VSRKPFAVIFAPDPSLMDGVHLAAAPEFNVETVSDPDRLFELIVNPRCFAVVVTDTGTIPPLLLIERGRGVSGATWFLFLISGSGISDEEAIAKGAQVCRLGFKSTTVSQMIWRAFGSVADRIGKGAWRFGDAFKAFAEGKGGYIELDGALVKWMEELRLRLGCDGWGVWSRSASDDFKVLKLSGRGFKDVGRGVYAAAQLATRSHDHVLWVPRAVMNYEHHAVLSFDASPKAAARFMVFLHFAKKPQEHVDALLKLLPAELKNIETGLLKLRQLSDLLAD
jgi:hypothetical protein